MNPWCPTYCAHHRHLSTPSSPLAIDHFVWLSHKHGTVFLPTSLRQLLYRLSRDNLKHFYWPNLSHHLIPFSYLYRVTDTKGLSAGVLSRLDPARKERTNDRVLGAVQTGSAEVSKVSRIVKLSVQWSGDDFTAGSWNSIKNLCSVLRNRRHLFCVHLFWYPSM